MKLRAEGCRKQYEIDPVNMLRALRHFIQFAEPRFREVKLIEEMVDLKRIVEAAVEEEKGERARREAEEIEKELHERESARQLGPDPDAAGGEDFE